MNITHINVGSGNEVTIKELAECIKEIVNYQGGIKFNNSFPDGVSSKLLDSTRINNLGWKVKINLYDGIKESYKCFLNNN